MIRLLRQLPDTPDRLAAPQDDNEGGDPILTSLEELAPQDEMLGAGLRQAGAGQVGQADRGRMTKGRQ